METGMIKRVCGLKFDLQYDGGKVDQGIIDLLASNGYLVEKQCGGVYNIFKEIKEEDESDDDEIPDIDDNP